MGKQTDPGKNATDHEDEVPMEPLMPQAPSKTSDTVKKKPFSSQDSDKHPKDFEKPGSSRSYRQSPHG